MFRLTAPTPGPSIEELADADTQYTPAWCTAALLRLEPPPPGTTSVLEPCAGRGAIVTPLLDAGYHVYAYERRPEAFDELRTRAAVPHLVVECRDALGEKWPAVPTVMNPPFSNAITWVRKALVESRAPYVAALLQANFWGASHRALFLEEYPPSDLLGLSPRPWAFPWACAWFVWGGRGLGFRAARRGV